MIDFNPYLRAFFDAVAKGDIDIYNEFSLQHEVGVYLRSELGPSFKIQFERPTSHFNLSTVKLVKKEIDLVVFRPNFPETYALEFKFPRTQVPEQMFKACKDIQFLEQLRDRGFSACYFVIATDDPLFFRRQDTPGIYRFFRSTDPISGVIHKPTGSKSERPVSRAGSYRVLWNRVTDACRYAVAAIH